MGKDNFKEACRILVERCGNCTGLSCEDCPGYKLYNKGVNCTQNGWRNCYKVYHKECPQTELNAKNWLEDHCLAPIKRTWRDLHHSHEYRDPSIKYENENGQMVDLEDALKIGMYDSSNFEMRVYKKLDMYHFDHSEDECQFEYTKKDFDKDVEKKVALADEAFSSKGQERGIAQRYLSSRVTAPTIGTDKEIRDYEIYVADLKRRGLI